VQRWEHLTPTITTFVEVISLPLQPISGISMASAGSWLQPVSRAEWRVLMRLRSTWDWPYPCGGWYWLVPFKNQLSLPLAVLEQFPNDSELSSRCHSEPNRPPG
jgi:hypothetical protein